MFLRMDLEGVLIVVIDSSDRDTANQFYLWNFIVGTSYHGLSFFRGKLAYRGQLCEFLMVEQPEL